MLPSRPMIYWIIFILMLISAFLIDYNNWRKDWLSRLIDKKVDEVAKKNNSQAKPYDIFNKASIFIFIMTIRRGIEKGFKSAIPNKIKLIFWVLFFLSISIFLHPINYKELFSNPCHWLFMKLQSDVSDYGNNLQILSGLIAVVFAMIIFLAESVRSEKDLDKRNALLSGSKLWEIGTFSILLLINFIGFKIYSLTIILELLLAFYTIWSLEILIENLLSLQALSRSTEKLFNQRIKYMITDSVKERIGNNILFEKLGLDKEIKIKYSPSKSWIDGEYEFINCPKAGIIIDIHLGGLKKLSEELEREANVLGFSIHDKQYVTLKSEEGKDLPPNEGHEIGEVYLLKRFGDRIDRDSIFNKDGKILFAVPKKLMRINKIRELISETAVNSFKFSNEIPPSESYKKEFKNTKDELIRAIKDTSYGKVTELKEYYIKFAEKFLETLHQFGGYSYEEAAKERNSIFDKWVEIGWLQDDIRELYDVAMRTENREIIKEIAYVPISISVRSIQARDHLMYQEFLPFASELYNLSQNITSKDVKNFTIDRSLRYLSEVRNYYIEPIVRDDEETTSKEDMDCYLGFVKFLIKQYQVILKQSFDKRDFTTFQKTIQAIDKISKHFDSERNGMDSDYWESLLETAEKEEKEIIQANIVRLKDKERIIKNIKSIKGELFFGFSSWILNKWNRNDSIDEFKSYYEELEKRLEISVEKLFELYISLRENDDHQSFWGWEWWDRDFSSEEPIFQAVDDDKMFDMFFCIKALNILNTTSIKDNQTLTQNFSYSIRYLLLKDGPLNQQLAEISSNKLLSSLSNLTKIDTLMCVIKNTLDKIEEIEEERLKVSIISEEKFDNFFQTLHNSFDKQASLRQLIMKLGNFRDKSQGDEINSKLKLWGFNQLDEKQAYIDDPNVHYSHWGEHYGEELAHAENERIMGDIVKKMPPKQISQAKIKTSLLSWLKKLNKEEVKDYVIIYTGYQDEWLNEFDHTRRWHDPDSKEFVKIIHYNGYINYNDNKIRIFNINTRKPELSGLIALIHLKSFGELVQYPPADKKSDLDHKKDKFYVNLIDLNIDDDTRQKIVSTGLEWLKKYSDPDGYLRSKVILNLYEKVEYKVMNKNSAYIIKILDEKENKPKLT